MTRGHWYENYSSEVIPDGRGSETLVSVPVASNVIHKDSMELHELIAYTNELERQIDELLEKLDDPLRGYPSIEIKNLRKYIKSGG